MPVQSFYGHSFWDDICRAGGKNKSAVYHYDQVSLQKSQASRMEGLKFFIGALNPVMNGVIVQLVKMRPLSYFSYQRSYLLSKGCGDLVDAKARVIRWFAELLVR